MFMQSHFYLFLENSMFVETAALESGFSNTECCVSLFQSGRAQPAAVVEFI